MLITSRFVNINNSFNKFNSSYFNTSKTLFSSIKINYNLIHTSKLKNKTKPDFITKIINDLEENKDDEMMLKYLIKHKYNKIIINNYEKKYLLKEVIKKNEKINKIYKNYIYKFYLCDKYCN